MKEGNGTVDFLKFIFSVVIVISHLGTMVLKDHGLSTMRGHISVEFFFIVSGFLAAKAAEKSKFPYTDLETLGTETKKYAVNKWIRLMPTYFVSFVGWMLFQYLKKPVGILSWLNVCLQDLPAFLLLSELGFGEAHVLPFGWYVPVVLIVSVFTWVMVRRFGRTYYSIFAPCLALFGGTYLFHTYGRILVLASEESWIGFTYASVIRGLVSVSLGAIGYCFCENLKRYKDRYTKFGVALFSICELSCFLIPVVFMFVGFRPMHTFMIAILFAIGVPMAFSGIGISGRIFSHRIFNWLGNFSYAVYLAQWVPLYWWGRTWFDNISMMSFLLGFVVITFASALALYYGTKLFCKACAYVWKMIKKWSLTDID